MDNKKRITVQFVEQECGQSCGIACVAMVTNKTFAQIREQVDHVPITNRKLHELLLANGVSPENVPFLELLPDNIYIMAAPSLNKGGSMHYIVVDTYPNHGYDVYDPLTGVKDKSFYVPETIKSWGVLTKILPL